MAQNTQFSGAFEDVLGWQNLLEILQAQGYNGRSALSQARFSCGNQVVYIYRSSSEVAPIVTPQGYPFGKEDAITSSKEISYQFQRGDFLEAATTWFYSTAEALVYFDITAAKW